MILELPLPPPELHAHNTGHWRKKAGPIKQCRQFAMYAAMAENEEPIERAEVSYDFFYPDNRGRDLANSVQSCKPYIDGVTDSGYIPDDKWQILSMGHVRGHICKENPRVVLSFKEITDE